MKTPSAWAGFAAAVVVGLGLGYGAGTALHSPAQDEPPAKAAAGEWEDVAHEMELAAKDSEAAAAAEPATAPPKAGNQGIRQLSLAQVQARLEELQNMPFSPETDALEQELVNRWAALDPRGAAEYAAQALLQGDGGRLMRKVANAWAKTDPAAASAWAASLDSPWSATRRSARFTVNGH